MPLTANLSAEDKSNFKSGRPIDRRAESPKQDSTVTKSKWPVVTKGVYAAMAKGVPESENSLNIRVKRLCRSRLKMYETMMVMDGALNAYNQQRQGVSPQDAAAGVAVYNELRNARAKLEAIWLKFPLEIR